MKKVATNTIDAGLLAKMFLAGAKNLEVKKEWINELNVFPVPDGDTGTNMTLTIMSAVKEVNSLTEVNMYNLSKAISSGSLRGARGNSGVILSQLLRGFTKKIRDYEELNAEILAEAMEKAVETAYKAVMKPKEGTILTVAKGAAEKAAELAPESEDLNAFIEDVLAHAEYVLSQTPEMLPVLKEAGVVDSGGQGLLTVLQGAYDAFLGKEIDLNFEMPEAKTEFVRPSKETEKEIKFGYCTEFIIMLENPLPDEEVYAFKDFLNGIGDSIVLVADDELVKVHVHTNDPGKAISKALTYGQLTRMKIDNMREEHQERLIKNAEKIAAQQAEEDKKRKEAAKQPPKENGFIAVSIGEGIKEIFQGLGVDYLIEGGQTMNPSTEDMLTAIEKVNAKNIFILPNNKNIILAANQASYSAIAWVVVFLIKRWAVGLVLGDAEPAIFNGAVEYLTVISVLFVLLGFLMIFRYTLQGLGYSVQAVISGVGELIGRALGGWLAVHQLGYLGICISNPLAWGFALCYCVFMVTRVLKKENRAA